MVVTGAADTAAAGAETEIVVDGLAIVGEVGAPPPQAAVNNSSAALTPSGAQTRVCPLVIPKLPMFQPVDYLSRIKTDIISAWKVRGGSFWMKPAQSE